MKLTVDLGDPAEIAHTRRVARMIRLEPADADRALRFCADHPERAVVLAGWIADGGLDRDPRSVRAWLFGAVDAKDELTGLLWLSDAGILIPVLPEGGGIEALVELGRRHARMIRVVVGERWLVDHVWRRWGVMGFESRLVRDQTGYVATRESFRPTSEGLQLRPAGLGDLDAVVENSAAMAREEARDDPQRRNPSMFRARIRERLQRGRDLVHYERSQLAFKANISAISDLGGQIEGIYTHPLLRGRGFGLRGTSEVTRWVLARAPRSCLLVNDDNLPARRLYDRLGYVTAYESRTIFVA